MKRPPGPSLTSVSTLDVWGLDNAAEAVYRAMLRHPDLDADGLAAHLGRDRTGVVASVDALELVGLVTAGPSGRSTTPPGTTLGALLQGELRTLEDRQARLDAVRANLAAFSADHLAGQTRSWASVPFEVLSEDDAHAAFEELQRGSTGEVLACHAVDDIADIPPAFFEVVREQLAAGRPMRAIYPAAVVDDPVKLAYVRHWAAAGEQVRLVPFAPLEIDVFGDDIALVSSSWEGRSGSMILIHAPAMVAIVRELFERYWDRAVPLGRIAGPATDRTDQRALLDLLMMGAKDESIARQLGVSLRTVRRRVADLMDELGATTRFQAGREAARRGLV